MKMTSGWLAPILCGGVVDRPIGTKLLPPIANAPG